MIRHVLAAGVVVAAGAIGSMACVDNESTLVIRGVTQPDADCVYSDVDTLLLGGALNSALQSSGYYGGLVLINEMVATGDEGKPQTEKSRIVLYDSEVTITDADGVELNRYSWPVAGFAQEGPNGEGFAEVLMVDSATLQAIGPNRVQLLSTVKVFGRTTGGLEVETPEFSFPIVVSPCAGVICDGSCLDDPGDVELSCYPGQNAQYTCNNVSGLRCTCCADVDPDVAADCQN